MSELTIDPTLFSSEKITSKIWDDQVEALHCHLDYDNWFSDYLQQPCQLVFFSDSSQRFVKNRKTQVGFADGYPLLLVNQASVDSLNTKLTTPVSALHFRPNIVIKGSTSFIEDNWARIRIGDIEFEVSKPCSRCLFINVDPSTGLATENEPLATLATFRHHRGEIDFGQNLIPLNSGFIRAGDEVKVLETKSPISYSSQCEQQNENEKIIKIHEQQLNIDVTGNNHQLLLDQTEQADISIPYSCRGGKCGQCKVKLLKGEVNNLSTEALTDAEKNEGYILACSCIPLSDITINR